MGAVLRIDHAGDLINAYAQAFREKLIFRNFQHDYPQHLVRSAINTDANQVNVQAILINNNIDYISGAGHGTHGEFIGENNLPIWDISTSLNLLGGKIVHLLACKSGGSLGPDMTDGGVTAFWGYTAEFVFGVKDSSPPSLEDDDVAQVFFEMDCTIDKGILTGRTSAEVYDSISDFVAHHWPKLSFANQGLLLSNFIYLACPAPKWGDPNTLML
jgi:hypothetical protein